jgi:hypothetical protein
MISHKAGVHSRKQKLKRKVVNNRRCCKYFRLTHKPPDIGGLLFKRGDGEKILEDRIRFIFRSTQLGEIATHLTAGHFGLFF